MVMRDWLDQHGSAGGRGRIWLSGVCIFTGDDPMRDAAAVIAALSIMQNPASSRLARRSALPRGMTFLLEIAAGEEEALEYARRAIGKSDDVLRSAAGFFVEQVLFAPSASHYRTLGLNADADARDLRRHMALLMKWVHPDTAGHNGADHLIDRSVFATRITEAWQVLKSDERRGLYDAEQAGAAGARRGRRSDVKRLTAIAQPRRRRRTGRSLLGKLFGQLLGRSGRSPQA